MTAGAGALSEKRISTSFHRTQEPPPACHQLPGTGPRAGTHHFHRVRDLGKGRPITGRCTIRRVFESGRPPPPCACRSVPGRSDHGCGKTACRLRTLSYAVLRLFGGRSTGLRLGRVRPFHQLVCSRDRRRIAFPQGPAEVSLAMPVDPGRNCQAGLAARVRVHLGECFP